MCTKCTVDINTEVSDAFAESLVGMLNHSALTLMISIGYRTGLFDQMADMDPATSQEIADRASLNERYVREWLGAMVSGKIISYDPNEQHYSLPAEHAAWLTRDRAPDNIAVTAQWIALLGQVEDKVVDCFENGGGLTYDDFPRFNEIMASESSQTVVIPLKDKLLPLVPGLTEKLEAGINVLDVGCGRGKALIRMATDFPNSIFTGYDFLESAVDDANAEVEVLGLSNITFIQKDAAAFDDTELYDAIFTFDSVHDQADPAAMLANIHRALKPDGVYFCQDIAGSSKVENNIDQALAPLLYTISCMSCMAVSLGAGGAGLGAMWGKELACQMMADAGFANTDVKELDHDMINYYYISTK